MLIFGEQHLRRVLATYAVHYNTARPHRALQLRPPRPRSSVPDPVYTRIRRQPVLGGLISQYEAAARKPQLTHSGQLLEPDRVSVIAGFGGDEVGGCVVVEEFGDGLGYAGEQGCGGCQGH